MLVQVYHCLSKIGRVTFLKEHFPKGSEFLNRVYLVSILVKGGTFSMIYEKNLIYLFRR